MGAVELVPKENEQNSWRHTKATWGHTKAAYITHLCTVQQFRFRYGTHRRA